MDWCLLQIYILAARCNKHSIIPPITKSSMLDEINPIISQLEQESISCTIAVLQSFHIDNEQISKVLFAKSIIKQSLEQVLRSHAVNFNSTIILPPRLSYKKDKIKSFKLIWTFAEKGPRTMTWNNLPNRENFMKGLEIDKWSKNINKKKHQSTILSWKWSLMWCFWKDLHITITA